VKRGLVLAFAVVLVCLWAAGAIAQERFTIELNDASLSGFVQQLQEKSGAKVVTDAALDSKITATLTNTTVEEALDSICNTYNLQWLRVRVALKEGDIVSGSALGRMIRAVSGSELAAVVVEPTEGQDSLACAQGPKTLPQAVEKVPFKDRTFQTVYFITSKEGKVESDDKVQRAVGIAKEQYKLMFEMTDEEKQAYFDEAMGIYMNLDPQIKAEMMVQSMRWMARMDPAARQRMMQESMQMMQQLPREELEAMFGGMVPPGFGEPQPPPGDEGDNGGDGGDGQ
jgi:hypothetical protein